MAKHVAESDGWAIGRKGCDLCKRCLEAIPSVEQYEAKLLERQKGV